ncbi:MAG: hypothetical protein GX903_03005 [Spirochaetales bacterium]|nr:hypothetical protein [Spirochaetales bacterium]
MFNPEELYKAVALDIYMDAELRSMDIPFEYLVFAYCIEEDELVFCNQRLYKFVERALGGTFRDILEWCESDEEEVYDNNFDDPYEYDENGMCYC